MGRNCHAIGEFPANLAEPCGTSWTIAVTEHIRELIQLISFNEGVESWADMEVRLLWRKKGVGHAAGAGFGGNLTTGAIGN